MPSEEYRCASDILLEDLKKNANKTSEEQEDVKKNATKTISKRKKSHIQCDYCLVITFVLSYTIFITCSTTMYLDLFQETALFFVVIIMLTSFVVTLLVGVIKCMGSNFYNS